jgi:hypothetical protein
MNSDAIAVLSPTPNPAVQVAVLIRQAQSWAEVEAAIAPHTEHKAAVWRLLPFEEKARIRTLKQLATEIPAIKVGSQVRWIGCPGGLEFLSPVIVREVAGDMVLLDWIRHPIPRSKLILEERSP